ncbi:DCC1-like thiol-disulfide oxidoreductase family protein [Myxococcota bacterium]|nr:DCC1-like thiol-disulfide oxidoreductase family protein [Myxococcota bacterium]
MLPIMGWTGVQYSILRGGIAAAVASVCLARLGHVEGPVWPLLALGIPGALALSIGWRDRALAFNLLLLIGGVAAFVDGAPLVLPRADVVFTSLLLIFHLLVPVTPFGSWDARERVDPRGDWVRPAWLAHASWLVLALIHGDRLIAFFASGVQSEAELALPFVGWILAVLRIGFIAALVYPPARPTAWIALTIAELAMLFVPGSPEGGGALLLLHAFAANPIWWPGRSQFLTTNTSDSTSGSISGSTSTDPSDSGPEKHEPARLFYDGDCGFCHRAVRIVLSEDLNTKDEIALRFAPLAGPTFERLTDTRDDIQADELPDSIVLILEDGQLLTRSAAAIEIASRLGGLWRGLAVVGAALPAEPLDAAYDAVARVRKKLFAKPNDACPILPPELRARFDA